MSDQVAVAWNDPEFGGKRRYLQEIGFRVSWTFSRSEARTFPNENAAYSYIVGRVVPRVMRVIEYERVAP